MNSSVLRGLLRRQYQPRRALQLLPPSLGTTRRHQVDDARRGTYVKAWHSLAHCPAKYPEGRGRWASKRTPVNGGDLARDNGEKVAHRLAMLSFADRDLDTKSVLDSHHELDIVQIHERDFRHGCQPSTSANKPIRSACVCKAIRSTDRGLPQTASSSRPPKQHATAYPKAFCFFFSKKKALP